MLMLSRLLAKLTLATILVPFVLDFEELANQVTDDPWPISVHSSPQILLPIHVFVKLELYVTRVA